MNNDNFVRISLTSVPLRFIVSPVNEITKAAALLGRKGGLAKSAKKAAAVRSNGKKGGRPKKKSNSDSRKKPILKASTRALQASTF